MLKTCNGCASLIPMGARRCERCTAARATHGYDSPAWRRVQREVMRTQPACVKCGKPARIVHHLHGLRPSSPGGLNPRNLEALCWGCHERAHA